MTEKKSKPKIILILGMHRSGTSIVAQMVEKWGAYFGENIMPPNEFNQDGYWEFNPLVAFHEKLLEFTNNKWFAPSEEISTKKLLIEFGDEAKQLVQRMDDKASVWCWKDPRMTLFIDFWMEILSNREVIYVISNRQAVDISSSLFKRDKLPISIAVALWEFTMYKIIEALSSGNKYIIINYNKLVFDPLNNCKGLFKFLNASLNQQQNDRFLNNMIQSVKRELNHAQPNILYNYSPNQLNLQLLFDQGIIPTDFNILKTRIWEIRELFSFFRKATNENKNWHFSQIFVKNELSDFSENDSLIYEFTGLPKQLRFKFNHSKEINQLRFDPINDFVQVKINSVILLKQSELIDIPKSYSCNALFVENQTYLFDTNDPQILIDFPQNKSIVIDEVIVNLEYLKKGVDALPLIIQLNNDLIQKQQAQIQENLELINKQKEMHSSLQSQFVALKNENFIKNELLQKQELQIQKDLELISKQKETHASLQIQNDTLKNENSLKNKIIREHEEKISSLHYSFDKKLVKINQLQLQTSQLNSKLTNILDSRSYKLLKLFISPIQLVRNKIKLFRAIRLMKRSGFYDESFYLRNNSDVKESGVPAIKHYLFYGGFEGRKPSEKFDSKFYLERNPDVMESSINPLLHYVKSGQEEGRLIQKSNEDFGYTEWIAKYDTLDKLGISKIMEAISNFSLSPLISVVMPVFDPNPDWLKAAIDSVLAQLYPNWELCIAEDCSTNPEVINILKSYQKRDSRVKVVFRETNGHISLASNSALELASGDFVALFDHDDILPIHALYWVANTINKKPDAKLIYSDEDKIDVSGVRSQPYFKSDWNRELFYSQNMISHLGVYSIDIVRLIGGFRQGYEGAQDYDLAIRFIEQINPDEIIHIPKILYHWRIHSKSTSLSGTVKAYGKEAGENALNSHFERAGLNVVATVDDTGHYRLKFQIPNPQPLVSIIIPTKNKVELLRQCIESIQSKTKYPNYEIIIVDNNSDEKDTLAYFDKIQVSRNVRIIQDNGAFNFSRICNNGVRFVEGEFVCLLNNDIEVISPDWLGEMVSLAVQPEIGAVGAKLIYPDGTIQHAGVIMGLGGVAGHVLSGQDRKTFGYFGRGKLVQELSAVTAACLVVSKSKYTEISGFNESDLAVAFNDVDFCLRLKQVGYRNLWTPYAELYHHESASRGRENTKAKQARFNKEVEYMNKNWAEIIQNDPAYNPNLSLIHGDFSLAWPPREVD